VCFELISEYEPLLLSAKQQYCSTKINDKGESVLTCEPAPLAERLCLRELKICRPQVPSMDAVYVCLVRMPYMYALYVCLILIPICALACRLRLLHALYVSRRCMP
jgi:hypothetical protein